MSLCPVYTRPATSADTKNNGHGEGHCTTMSDQTIACSIDCVYSRGGQHGQNLCKKHYLKYHSQPLLMMMYLLSVEIIYAVVGESPVTEPMSEFIYNRKCQTRSKIA